MSYEITTNTYLNQDGTYSIIDPGCLIFHESEEIIERDDAIKRIADIEQVSLEKATDMAQTAEMEFNITPPMTEAQIAFKVQVYEDHLKRTGQYEDYMDFLEKQDLQK